MTYCRDCKFWDCKFWDVVNGYKGTCLRRAPVLMPNPWPVTTAEDTCGQFRPHHLDETSDLQKKAIALLKTAIVQHVEEGGRCTYADEYSVLCRGVCTYCGLTRALDAVRILDR